MTEEKNSKFCSNCGAEIDIKAKICPKCGVEQPIIPENVSNWWYLCPIFLGIIGGLVAWIVNKDVNPKKAKKLLIVGIIVPIVWVVVYLIMHLVIIFALGGARERAQTAATTSMLVAIRPGISMCCSNPSNNLKIQPGKDICDPVINANLPTADELNATRVVYDLIGDCGDVSSGYQITLTGHPNNDCNGVAWRLTGLSVEPPLGCR